MYLFSNSLFPPGRTFIVFNFKLIVTNFFFNFFSIDRSFNFFRQDFFLQIDSVDFALISIACP